MPINFVKKYIQTRLIFVFCALIMLSLIFVVVYGVMFSIKPAPKTMSALVVKPGISVTTMPQHPDATADFKLTLADLFDAENKAENIPQDQLTTILMTGDIMVGRYVNVLVTRRGDFNYPYLKTKARLQAADIAVANLETPLTAACALTSEGMSFCADIRHAPALAVAGFDLVSLANNHTLNRGVAGLAETKEVLTKNKIGYAHNTETWRTEHRGVRFEFIACNDVSEDMSVPTVVQQIREARERSDVVIVLPHWGAEYTRVPRAAGGVAPHDPKKTAREFIDAGADLILGNHPHWYQGFEIYKNKLIAYSHGNFVFDQSWSEETKLGFVGEYFFYGTKLVDLKIHPVYIQGNVQPVWLIGAPAQAVLREITENSWE